MNGFVALSLLVIAFAPSAAAQSVNLGGVLNFTGSMSVTLNAVDFFPLGGGAGSFMIEPTSRGAFASLGGQTGTTKDLNLAGSNIPDLLVLPNPANTIHFTLTSFLVPAGVPVGCPTVPAAGQTCTPQAGSPLILSNVGGGSSTMSFSINGVAFHTSAPAAHFPFTGTFTTQFTGLPLQALVQTFNAGGAVQTSFSANFDVSSSPALCTPPRTVFADNSGAFGLFEGVVNNVRVGEMTTSSVDLRPTILLNVPFLQKGVRFWVSIDEIAFDPSAASLQPSLSDPVGGTAADFRLIPPGTHATFDVFFCRPSTVTFELGLNERAIILTMADSVISLVPLVGSISPARILAFTDSLGNIPLIASAVLHYGNAFKAASTGNTGLAFQELAAAGKTILELAFNPTQLKQIGDAFASLGINLEVSVLFRAVLRVPARLFEIFGDVIVLSVQTGLGRAGPIRISVVGR